MYSVPENSVEKGFLNELIPQIHSLGVILSGDGVDQLTHEVLLSLQDNHPLEDEFIIFTQNVPKFITTPACGVFHTKKLPLFRGDLVCIDLGDVFDATRIPHINKVIWYVRDLSQINHMNADYCSDVLKDKKIIKLFPNEMYSKILLSGFEGTPMKKSSKIHMPSFDYETIRTILSQENLNDQTGNID